MLNYILLGYAIVHVDKIISLEIGKLFSLKKTLSLILSET